MSFPKAPSPPPSPPPRSSSAAQNLRADEGIQGASRTTGPFRLSPDGRPHAWAARKALPARLGLHPERVAVLHIRVVTRRIAAIVRRRLRRRRGRHLAIDRWVGIVSVRIRVGRIAL